jgi:tRNA-dihydrouridine synthase A
MMECTDRHARYLLRLISRRTLLYTEMVPVTTLIYGNRERALAFHAFERPVALQIGGSDPSHMALSARFGEDYGYQEINLNVGCPSDRVRSGQFGACLMAQPERVAECVHAMAHTVRLPVTVKCRIGIDDQDTLENLCSFIDIVSDAGCEVFVIHARKAWLKGLSPRKNRTVPPLRYEIVHAIKREFPHLTIVINGGITSLDAAARQLDSVDGVMIGRQAYADPYLLADVDRRFYDDRQPVISRESVLEQYLEYCTQQLAAGCRLHRLSRHLLGLFHSQPRARLWRRHLSEHVNHPGAGIEVIRDAARAVLSPAM